MLQDAIIAVENQVSQTCLIEFISPTGYVYFDAKTIGTVEQNP